MNGHDVLQGFDLREAASRAAVCHWLAGVFLRPPAESEITALRSGAAAAWLAVLAREDALSSGIGLIRTALGADLSDRDLAIRLGAIHARLFSGLGGPSTVVPYESAYCGSHRLYQAPVSDMAEMLRRHDVHVAERWAEAPDHVSVELALLARLLAAGYGDSAGLIGRLGRWVPRFAGDCAARDPAGYFAGAAQVLAATITISALPSPHDTLTAQTGVCDDQHHHA